MPFCGESDSQFDVKAYFSKGVETNHHVEHDMIMDVLELFPIIEETKSKIEGARTKRGPSSN